MCLQKTHPYNNISCEGAARFGKRFGLLILLPFIVNIILLNVCPTAGRPQGVGEELLNLREVVLKHTIRNGVANLK